MARPSRGLKVKNSFKRCPPRRIRIVYDDPEATDSSEDEGGENSQRRRTVHEFRVASRPHSTASASSASSPIPGRIRLIDGVRVWSWRKRPDEVVLPAESHGFWLGSCSTQVEAIVICGEEKETCSSTGSEVFVADAGDRSGEYFPSPASMLETSAVESGLLSTTYQKMPFVCLPEETAAQGVGSFVSFGFESCDWTGELWFRSPRADQRTVEWASTDEVENFFAS
ncbi:hypothetical protein HPP92_004410 [Vanilla planifolia]|uniref:Uncharacterized protein n=1 Tax=Vanilla planifolia TaxID=51239 RepID=A0A835RJS0_VANPL|nr:hypothetical protein HPP92_004410 [Vanilla planifolia]